MMSTKPDNIGECMNTNTRFDEIKRPDGTTTIRLRFSSRECEVVLPIDVKPITPTAAEVKKYGGIKEFCRCDITKWEVVGAPKISLKYVNRLIGKTIWTYFNGYERNWKFQDPDGCIDAKNARLYIIPSKLTDTFIDRLDIYLEDNDDDFYAPHNDALCIYGNSDVHAVYDMKAKAKACDVSKKKLSPVKKDNAGRLDGMPKKFEWCNDVPDCFLYANCFLYDARQSRSKISFADFGKALRTVVNYETDDIELGKSMVKVIDYYRSIIKQFKSKNTK